MLIYLHIAKTGGTTMLHYLARQRLSLDALEALGKAKKDGAAVTDLPMFEGLGTSPTYAPKGLRS